MSHFNVAVITRNNPSKLELDGILEPYREKKLPFPHLNETPEQYLKNKRAHNEEYKKNYYDKYMADPEGYEKNCGGASGHVEYVKNFMKNVYNLTDEQILEKRKSEYQMWNAAEIDTSEEYLDQYGNTWSYWNPLGKWDWFSIGGRFVGAMKLKSGQSVQIARIEDIDFGDVSKLVEDEKIKETYQEYISSGDGLYNAKFYQEYYPTIESYVRATYCFSTFAVIDQNGVWHQVGDMGWFGMSNETADESINWYREYYDRFIKDIDKNWYITLVDCHI